MEKFKNKIWLSSPTMHGDELKYMKEAYEKNWMSTVGENINEVELDVNMQLHYLQELLHYIWRLSLQV